MNGIVTSEDIFPYNIWPKPQIEPSFELTSFSSLNLITHKTKDTNSSASLYQTPWPLPIDVCVSTSQYHKNTQRGPLPDIEKKISMNAIFVENTCLPNLSNTLSFSSTETLSLVWACILNLQFYSDLVIYMNDFDSNTSADQTLRPHKNWDTQMTLLATLQTQMHLMRLCVNIIDNWVYGLTELLTWKHTKWFHRHVFWTWKSKLPSPKQWTWQLICWIGRWLLLTPGLPAIKHGRIRSK